MRNKTKISTNTLMRIRNYGNGVFIIVAGGMFFIIHNKANFILYGLCILNILLNGLISRQLIREVEMYSDILEKNITQIIQEGKMQKFFKYQDSLLSKSQMQLARLCDHMERVIGEAKRDKEILQGLVSDIAHQVKTPIANAVLYTTALQKNNLSDEKKASYLKILLEQIDKLDFLMDNLLKMSRLEVGIFLLSPQVLSIQETLAGVLGSVAIKAAEKDIMIRVECGEELTALHDRKWTGEVLENVLDNAVKYTPEHGNITVSVKRYEIYTLIEISDTGIGISQDEIPKIFQRFYRGKNVRDKAGVGIGLYLARQILGMEKGGISVQSVCGKGSKFSIYLSND